MYCWFVKVMKRLITWNLGPVCHPRNKRVHSICKRGCTIGLHHLLDSITFPQYKLLQFLTNKFILRKRHKLLSGIGAAIYHLHHVRTRSYCLKNLLIIPLVCQSDETFDHLEIMTGMTPKQQNVHGICNRGCTIGLHHPLDELPFPSISCSIS